MTKVRHLWEVATSGYLLVPTVMTGGAIALSIATTYVDDYLPPKSSQGWFYSGSANAAREMLSTIAGSIITVAGVVFSITVVVLTQASSQFGPRLLRNFMRDRTSQLVLGTLVGTFIFSILVLKTVRDQEDLEFIPHLGVTVSVLLAGASIAALIYFIHHLASSLQPSMIIAAVYKDLEQSMDDVWQDAGEAGNSKLPPQKTEDDNVVTIQSGRDGYIQAIDYATLVEEATKAELTIRLDCRPGDHVIKGDDLMRACKKVQMDPHLQHKLINALIIGKQRTPEQDPEYAIRQLVEIAVRALSPGINDPFTAINCIDALGSGLCLISRRTLPSGTYCDPTGRLRVVARCLTFSGLVDAAFSQIRQYGCGSPAVVIRMLDVIKAVASHVTDESGRQSLLRHARMISQDAREHVSQEQDWADIKTRYDAAVEALGS